MAKPLHPHLRNLAERNAAHPDAIEENRKRQKRADKLALRATRARFAPLIDLADLIAEKACDQAVAPNITVVQQGNRRIQALGWRVLTYMSHQAGAPIDPSTGKAQPFETSAWESIMLRRDGLLVAYHLPPDPKLKEPFERGGVITSGGYAVTTAGYVPRYTADSRPIFDMRKPATEVVEDPVTVLATQKDFTPPQEFGEPEFYIQKGLMEIVDMHNLRII